MTYIVFTYLCTYEIYVCDVSCDVFTTLNIYTYIYSVDSASNYDLQVYKYSTLLIIVIRDYDAIFLDVVSFRSEMAMQYLYMEALPLRSNVGEFVFILIAQRLVLLCPLLLLFRL